MYSKLPLKFIGITDNFGLRKDPITGVSSYHYGLDLGWNDYQGEPVMASHDGKIVYEGYDSGLGNHVVLKYTEGKNTIINRYLHLKNRAIVKKGQKVKQGEVLGYMGNSGRSTAVHLHFEYWICPSTYIYRIYDAGKYAKDPLDYCYLFDDQGVSSASSTKVVRVIGFGTSRNKKKNQIQVVKKFLRCRKEPSTSGKILGYINLGYFDILDTKVSSGNTWYKIGNNRWIADVKGYTVKYLVKEDIPKPSDDLDQDIDNNKTDDKITNNTDDKDNTDNTNNKDDKDSSSLDNKEIIDNYNSFKALKSDYYYIYLEKGETIYFPK